MLNPEHNTPTFVKNITMKEDILIRFGERVRELRSTLNISQEELSFRADMHRTYIGMIERAEKNITLVNMAKLAKGLGVSLSELLKGIE